jgi:hypothetical protein
MSSFKVEISENFSSYKTELQNYLLKLASENQSITLSLDKIDSKKNDKIELLIKECENNVISFFILINKIKVEAFEN